MIIAVDGMGGDHAPEAVVGGVKLALDRLKGIKKLLLVGHETRLQAELDRQSVRSPRVELVPSHSVVEMTDLSTAAVRSKKDSSVTVAADLVKKGQAQALVSAGHTGASVAVTSVKWRTLPGVERPGIASPMPAEHGITSLLDAGANVEAKPLHLLHYGIMGSVYARQIYGVAKPKVGLMSVGEEDHKGSDFTREVFHLLKETDLHFVGNVEGRDILNGGLDVIVTDGFTGNVVLKTVEGTAKAVGGWLKTELRANPLRLLGALLARGAFSAVKARGNYETYGGSPLLGVRGVCIIGHGGSSPLAVMNAIRVAGEAVQQAVNPQIEDEIQRFHA
ncbi:MAG: phosphate acyltransferase PlsX [Verrucomicrobiota bacterium]